MRARSTAKRHGAYWKGLVRSTSGAVGVCLNGRLLAWSRGAQKLFGYSAREVPGRFCCDISAGCDDRGARICSKDCAPFRAARAGRPVPTVVMHVKPKAGRPIQVTCSMLTLPTTSPAGFISVHLFHEVSGVSPPAAQPAEPPRQRAAHATGTAAALTPHQRNILQLLSTGMTTESLAESLRVSPKTIRNHLEKIFLRLGVHSRLEAVLVAVASGLVSRSPTEPGPPSRSGGAPRAAAAPERPRAPAIPPVPGALRPGMSPGRPKGQMPHESEPGPADLSSKFSGRVQ